MIFRVFRVFNVLPGFLLTAQGVFADDYLPNELKSSLKQHSYEPNIWGVIFSLLLVICLIYLTGIVYQKLIKINPKCFQNDSEETVKNEFNILSNKALGQNRSVHAVEINDKILILGSTPNNITLLSEFSKENEIEKP